MNNQYNYYLSLSIGGYSTPSSWYTYSISNFTQNYGSSFGSQNYNVASKTPLAPALPKQNQGQNHEKQSPSKIGSSSPNNTPKVPYKNSPDQDALIQLAKENKRGISMTNALILESWGQEYNLPNSRIDLGHPNRNGINQRPHTHYGPVNHIPIFPE